MIRNLGIGMNEILENQKKIVELLRRRNGREMTESEYREQSISYVVGNAFDVFSDTEVINRKMLKQIAKRRLSIAS